MHSALLWVIRVGTSKAKSQKELNRVLWTNITACLLLSAIVPFTIMHAVTSSEFHAHIIAARCITAALAFTSVLVLNNLGVFWISKVVVIVPILLAATITSLSNDVFDATPLYFAPVAMSFTLFDAASLKQCAPLAVVSALCFTTVRWKNNSSDNPFLGSFAGLVTFAIVAVCFHLLAKESLSHEEELNRVVAGLTNEVQIREAIQNSLRKANQVKQDFLATMSHELRTPINGVVASVELLSDTPLNAEQRDLTITITSSAMALITVINDILDFSKIEAGKMSIESVALNVRHATEEVLDCLAPRADERGVELVCDVAGPLLSDGVVLSDPGRFRQLLLNLIGNAVKFTQDGSVSVSAKLSLLAPHPSPVPNSSDDPAVTATAPEAASGDVVNLTNGNNSSNSGGTNTPDLLLCVEVEDSGEGIPPDRIDTLFHAFTQADTSTSRTHGGTGLGLAICSKLVELMGGSIGVKSQLGQGSTFSFSMVVKPDPTTSLEDLIGRLETTGVDGSSGDGGSGGGGGSAGSTGGGAGVETGAGAWAGDGAGAIAGAGVETGAGAIAGAGDGAGAGARAGAETGAGAGFGSSGERFQCQPRIHSASDQEEAYEQAPAQNASGVGGHNGGASSDAVRDTVVPPHVVPPPSSAVESLNSGQASTLRAPALPPLITSLPRLPVPQPQQQQRELVVVVWEPLARARDALCRLLRHHHRRLSDPRGISEADEPDQVEGGGVPGWEGMRGGGQGLYRTRVEELVVRPVPQPADFEALVRVLEEEEERRRRSTTSASSGGMGAGRCVLVCDYRSFRGGASFSSPTGGGAVAGDHPGLGGQQRHLQLEKLGGLLRRLDVGVVLLGPRSHRSSLNQLHGGGATGGVGGVEVGQLSLAELFQSSDGAGGGDRESGVRSVWVNKPVHQAALLEALHQLANQRRHHRAEKKLSLCDLSDSCNTPLTPSSSNSNSGNAKSLANGGGVSAGKGGGNKKVWKGDGDIEERQENEGKGECKTIEAATGRVLVVEDNKVNQKVMGKMLTRLGVDFDIVENGQLAVEAWTRGQEERGDNRQERYPNYYDVVLMDCHMPVMDGFEATAAIRKLEGGGGIQKPSVVREKERTTGGIGRGGSGEKVSGRIPIIAVTASALEEELQMCRDVGMDSVMVKPVRLAKLYEALAPYVTCSNPLCP